MSEEENVNAAETAAGAAGNASDRPGVSVIIPALNEEGTIGEVIGRIPRELVDEILVVDNGSSDATAEEARKAGARVVHEPRRGYGNACMKGLTEAAEAFAYVFLDADLSDSPERMPNILAPILDGEADLVIGSRRLGEAEPGAVSPAARWGNRLACFLIRLLLGHRYTDLGPFRAVSADGLAKLKMSNPGSGWPVEMQIRAVQEGLCIKEVSVPYRARRHGKSKVSGNVWGIMEASWRIITTILLCYIRHGRPKSTQPNEAQA